VIYSYQFDFVDIFKSDNLLIGLLNEQTESIVFFSLFIVFVFSEPHDFMALTFLVKREILREAFFLWIRPLDAALFKAGTAAFKAFWELSLFLDSTLVMTDLIFVLSADFAAILRLRFALFCLSRFSADLCVAKVILLNLFNNSSLASPII
jgi:hypothetical protein